MIRPSPLTALAVALATVLAATLPAMAVEPALDEALAAGQELAIAIPQEIRSLDPAMATSRGETDLLNQLFEGLMTADADGAPVPGAAAEYSLSPDRKTYEFRLRETKWSNGDPLTAADFAFAWRRVLDPETASPHAWFIEAMNVENAAAIARREKPPEDLGIRVLDDRRLQVTLTGPMPHFLKMLSHPATFPVPMKLVAAEGADWAQPGKLAGNGAYRLDGQSPGGEAVLSGNPGYHGAAGTILTGLRFVPVSEPGEALKRYLDGEFDWLLQPPAGQIARLRQDHPGQAITPPYACSYGYLFNLSAKGAPALKERALRQALSDALDRDAIAGAVLRGGQRPALGWTHWAANGRIAPDIETSDWSLDERREKARALLAEAGYGPERPLRLMLRLNRSEGDRAVAQAARQAWQEIGVEAELAEDAWSRFHERLQDGDFDLARYAWCADYNDPRSFLDLSGSGRSIGAWSNAEYDALLERALAAEDPAPLYRQAEEMLLGDMALIPLYHYTRPMLIRPDLRGYPMRNALGQWYAREMYRVAP
ncbi:oligopeptide transport system substrate-binding protein [Paracoccus halophilus]|uniref:Oligopeptide transport system substrate-binding protein n=1 Tax=Paracoccus halophilus TaxID=376733 RepID=A0A099F7M9_9RHOB|nr:peptide ABC transporter substrate-binding protein [Paracoccus halophilus]KGJ06112.1 hypothetical protein IT41_02830 [Paracoccus halophilus]SFA46237.1 oligopeptide transport system substrate-binding protein [Paracoccus halophilus]